MPLYKEDFEFLKGASETADSKYSTSTSRIRGSGNGAGNLRFMS